MIYNLKKFKYFKRIIKNRIIILFLISYNKILKKVKKDSFQSKVYRIKNMEFLQSHKLVLLF